MSKFVLDCAAVQDAASQISNFSSSLDSIGSDISSYNVSNPDFDFEGPKQAIVVNVIAASVKMSNTTALINKVVDEHTSLQNRLKYEPSLPQKSSSTTSSTSTGSGQISEVKEYVVESGDTLSEIAESHGTSVEAIVDANDIDNPNLIHVGDNLIISDVETSSNSTLNESSRNAEDIEIDDSNSINSRNVKKIIDVPPGLGNVHTYMGWQMITARGTEQYRLKDETGMNFDNEGFGIVDGRYVIACTTTYGKPGDLIDFVQEDGSVIECVVGDIKSQGDAGCNKWGHNDGNCIVEFVVDKSSWYGGNHPNPGTSSCHPEWNQNIVKAINYGSYFD